MNIHEAVLPGNMSRSHGDYDRKRGHGPSEDSGDSGNDNIGEEDDEEFSPSFASPPPGPARSICPTFVSPVPPQASGSEEDDDASVRPREMVAFDALKEGRHSALSGITELVNGFNRLFGYGRINQNRVDSSSAYYRCGCGRKGCFNIVFSREKGATGQWFIKSIAPHLCQPSEEHAIALSNTYIPHDVKQHLVHLFDQDIGAADAHSQGNFRLCARWRWVCKGGEGQCWRFELCLIGV